MDLHLTAEHEQYELQPLVSPRPPPLQREWSRVASTEEDLLDHLAYDSPDRSSVINDDEAIIAEHTRRRLIREGKRRQIDDPAPDAHETTIHDSGAADSGPVPVAQAITASNQQKGTIADSAPVKLVNPGLQGRYMVSYSSLVDTIMIVKPLGGNEAKLAALLQNLVAVTHKKGDRGVLHYSLMELRSETHEFHLRATYENHMAMYSHRRKTYENAAGLDKKKPSLYYETIRQIENEGLGVFKLRETRYWPLKNFTTCARVDEKLYECSECKKEKEKTWMADAEDVGFKRGIKMAKGVIAKIVNG